MSGEPWAPNRFTIDPAKITNYLLDPTHEDGGPKCKFLAQFGFTPELPGDLLRAIDMHRIPENFSGTAPGYLATKLYFDGPLISPGMDNPNVRTVWQLDDDDTTRTARFITLKPRPRIKAKPHA